VVDRIVAQVNEEIITLSELEQAAKSVASQMDVKSGVKQDLAFQRQMLESLIDRKLALAEAKKRGITISDRDLEESLQQFRKRNTLTDDATFTKALTQAGLTLKELKQQISDQIMQERMVQVAVGTKTTVSEADIRRIYDSSTKEGGSQVHLRVINAPFPPGATQAQKEELRQKMDLILKEVKEGRSFAATAKKYAVDEADLGFISQGDMNPQLAEHLKRLRPGEVAPVQTPGGFQLLQLVDRRSGASRSYEEAAPEIRRMLLQQDMEKRFGDWVKTLREKAFIKIML
jgi:peptidyl-prolyl cis-trans isomerase SurA